MPLPGTGFGSHVTSLTHDERGYPATDATTHDRLVRRLYDKIGLFTDEITQVERVDLDDADIAVVTYGSTSRTARRAISMAREAGIRAGILRLISIWPFPEAEIAALNDRCQAIVVAELNLGQIRHEVERVARVPVFGAHHAGGALMPPEIIFESIKEAAGYAQGTGGRTASSRSLTAV
jgi:2-oxoglutarate ferredoxin oxidoreductase subunit alpha